MTKNEFRSFFAQCKPFLKIKYFLNLADISPVNFSRFMKGSEWDYEMSLESLNKLYYIVKTHFEEFINIA